MKYTILIFLLLIACKPIVQPVATSTPQATAQLLTLSQVVDEFAVLDADFNTSWHEEEIPKNLIPLEAIEPWTKRLQLMKNLTEPGSLPEMLVEARLDMLRAQISYYLGKEIGEKGEVPLKQEGINFTAGQINCENKNEIATATKLYSLSYKSWLEFQLALDEILQKSQEAREKIGIDEKRPAFYNSLFGTAQHKIDAIVEAMKQQCGVALNLDG
jgi:hypothetical protein